MSLTSFFVVFLVLGIVRGRKNGMSGELFQVLQWVAVLVGCAFLYDKISPLLAGPLHLSDLAANMFGYNHSGIGDSGRVCGGASYHWLQTCWE